MSAQTPEILATPGAAMGAALALVAFLAVVATILTVLWARQRARVRSLAADLEHERRRADEAAHAAEAFFALVSHEFRSPIAAIIGYQELLRDHAYGDIGDAALDPLDRIGRSANLLMHLIDGSLDLARRRTGDLSPDLQVTNLRELMEEVADEFRQHCAERKLRHTVHLDTDLPTITSDPERITRALHLLMVSAVKNPSGERLELRATTEPDGATVQIRGTRIPVRSDALDPALRTGIRIAIAAAVAELLAGSLQLHPADGPQAAEAVFRIRDAGARP
jgi:signal transduction histidine kinase